MLTGFLGLNVVLRVARSVPVLSQRRRMGHAPREPCPGRRRPAHRTAKTLATFLLMSVSHPVSTTSNSLGIHANIDG